MEKELVVYTFQKNSEEEVRFTLTSYKERCYLDLRLWFLPTGGGEYRPTRKGITLALEYLPELKKGLERTGKSGAELTLQETSNPVK